MERNTKSIVLSIVDAAILSVIVAGSWHIANKNYFGVSSNWEDTICITVIPMLTGLCWVLYLVGLRSLKGSCLTTLVAAFWFLQMSYYFIVKSGA